MITQIIIDFGTSCEAIPNLNSFEQLKTEL